MNTLRKHLSAIKGGRLAAAAHPAHVVSLLISDVPGDDPAIIGSGPAGLSAAYHLARRGITSTIFEALPQAGGMLRVGIPEHRLPREVLDREIELITNLGVDIKTNTPFGPDLSFDDLFEQGFDRTPVMSSMTTVNHIPRGTFADIPVEWGTYSIQLPIIPELVGQFIQIGFAGLMQMLQRLFQQGDGILAS